MAAAASRSMMKSSSAALNLFNNSKPIVNRMLTLRALPPVESAASQLVNQMKGFDEKMPSQQQPVRIMRPRSVSEEMLMARNSRKVPDVEEDDDDVEEFEDESDFEMIDEEDDEDDDDEFDDEDDEFVKTKVRTRSHRDL